MSNPENKKGCGCVAKGCLVMAIIAGILVGVMVWGYNRLAGQMRTHTSDKSAEVAVEKTTRDEYEALVKRLNAFKDTRPGSEATLELTAHDLNVLIAYSPDWANVNGLIHASIEQDQITLAGSIPLLYIPGLRDQFLNGSITFNLSMDDKVLHLYVQGIKLKNEELSKETVKAFSAGADTNLTNRLLGDPVLGPVLIKAKTLKIKDGVIVLTFG